MGFSKFSNREVSQNAVCHQQVLKNWTPIIEQHTVKLNKPPIRGSREIDCPFSMPTDRTELAWEQGLRSRKRPRYLVWWARPANPYPYPQHSIKEAACRLRRTAPRPVTPDRRRPGNRLHGVWNPQGAFLFPSDRPVQRRTPQGGKRGSEKVRRSWKRRRTVR